MKKKFILIFNIIFCVFLLLACNNEVAPSEIALLFTNDVHCGFDVSDESFGISALAGLKEETINEYGKENVTLIDAGDFIQGQAIGTISNGKYPVEIQKHLRYDIGTLGNHEFDYGMESLIGENGLITSSTMEYVACNFIDTRTSKTVVKPYVIKKYGDLQIAYVGIVTPETYTSSTPSFFQDENGNWIYEFCGGNNGEKLYSTVQNNVDQAIKDGADYVVAIAHLGIEEEASPYRSTDVIKNTIGIDVVIDGHSHSIINNQKVLNKEGDEVSLTSTGTGLINVGKLVIETNETVSKKDDTITIDLVSGSDKEEYLEYESAKEAALFLEEIQSEFESTLNEVVARSEVELSLYNENGTRIIRNSEAALGDLCADAYRSISGADVALVNGGGIRAGINKGDITFNDIINIHPYGNYLCVVEVTGAELLDILEFSYRAVMTEVESLADDNGYYSVGESGGFQQVSGIRFTIDPSVASSVVVDENGMFVSVNGERRVKDVQILINGEFVDIDLNKTYTLASHNYMIKSGGDGFGMLQDNNLLLNEVMIDNQVLITYIQNVLGGNITADYVASLGGRINILGRE